MPLPTLICLAFASGIAAALAARVELRVSPRPPLLTQSFGAYLVFAMLVLVPVGVYFYVFHGDWFLLYTFDVSRVPSALALIGFLVLAGVGSLGFAVGASMVRGQRDTLGGILVGLSVLAAGAVAVVARDRLGVVGNFAQFEGGFGLKTFGSGPLMQGALTMGGILLVGAMFLLLRLRASGRRGA
ncbi:MAG: hypothetical protein AAGE52_26345 [Myxococcota bacterium]